MQAWLSSAGGPKSTEKFPNGLDGLLAEPGLVIYILWGGEKRAVRARAIMVGVTKPLLQETYGLDDLRVLGDPAGRGGSSGPYGPSALWCPRWLKT